MAVISWIILGCRAVARLPGAFRGDCDVYKQAVCPASSFVLPIFYQSCTGTVDLFCSDVCFCINFFFFSAAMFLF